MSAARSIAAGARRWPLDDQRGTWGMYLVIATEAMLFALLFFSYFYLGRHQPHWPTSRDPGLALALPMTAILVSSSFVLYRAERLLKNGARERSRAWVTGTVMLGMAFVAMQATEYVKHIKETPPSTDAYTSIFYTITSIHGAHVVIGVLMLGFVLLLPPGQLEPASRPPHRALHNASLYWHFVDVVWLFIISILYVWPHLKP